MPRPRKKMTRTPLDDIMDEIQRVAYMPNPVALYATLAAVVGNYIANRKPVWLMLVGPPSSGKSMMVSMVSRLDKMKELGSLTSKAAFIAVKKQRKDLKEYSKGSGSGGGGGGGGGSHSHIPAATGGLLFEVGKFGIFTTKDFTSILALSQERQAEVLGALREIYDGAWSRSYGEDGGNSVTWEGKIGFLGGVTPVIDAKHAVISELGDRWLYLRWPPGTDDNYRQSMMSICREEEPEHKIPALVNAYIDSLNLPNDSSLLIEDDLTEHDHDRIIRMSKLVALCRVVIRRNPFDKNDYSIPTVEYPIRVINGLLCIYRAMYYMDIPRSWRWKVLYRLMIDSMPILRGLIIKHLLKVESGIVNPPTAYELADVLCCGYTTASVACEDLKNVGVLYCEADKSRNTTAFRWRLTPETYKVLSRVDKFLLQADEEYTSEELELD